MAEQGSFWSGLFSIATSPGGVVVVVVLGLAAFLFAGKGQQMLAFYNTGTQNQGTMANPARQAKKN